MGIDKPLQVSLENCSMVASSWHLIDNIHLNTATSDHWPTGSTSRWVRVDLAKRDIKSLAVLWCSTLSSDNDWKAFLWYADKGLSVDLEMFSICCMCFASGNLPLQRRQQWHHQLILIPQTRMRPQRGLRKRKRQSVCWGSVYRWS